MNEPFDPYHVWLGIPKKDQPPDHYRLLTLERFEDHPPTIENAADRQMAHLRTFQIGPRAAHSQRILSEIATARRCLLDSEKKGEYDRQLQEDQLQHIEPPIHVRPEQPPRAGLGEPPIQTEPPAQTGPPVQTGPPIQMGLVAQNDPSEFAGILHAQPPVIVEALPTVKVFSEIQPPSIPPPIPQADPAPQTDPRPSFGDYVLLEEIGDSRTGKFLKARHQSTGEVVALKMLSPRAMRSQELLDRFHRKIEILARLEHPNLVAAHDAGRIEGTPYFITEYVDGQDLREWVEQFHPIRTDYVVNYIMQAAAGLGYAHSLGIYHRNVKPSNLLVSTKGVVKVIGLGLARYRDAAAGNGVDLTTPGGVVGTVDYMAPEQAVDSTRIDPRADLYSLGCTLFFALSGRRPYPGKSPMQKIVAHRDAPIPSLRPDRPDVSESLDAVCRKMLAKSPDDRFASMQEAITAIQST